jgi:hypothetical protein
VDPPLACDGAGAVAAAAVAPVGAPPPATPANARRPSANFETRLWVASGNARGAPAPRPAPGAAAVEPPPLPAPPLLLLLGAVGGAPAPVGVRSRMSPRMPGMAGASTPAGRGGAGGGVGGGKGQARAVAPAVCQWACGGTAVTGAAAGGRPAAARPSPSLVALLGAGACGVAAAGGGSGVSAPGAGAVPARGRPMRVTLAAGRLSPDSKASCKVWCGKPHFRSGAAAAAPRRGAPLQASPRPWQRHECIPSAHLKLQEILIVVCKQLTSQAARILHSDDLRRVFRNHWQGKHTAALFHDG